MKLKKLKHLKYRPLPKAIGKMAVLRAQEIAAGNDAYDAMLKLAEALKMTPREMFLRYRDPDAGPLPVIYVNPKNVSEKWNGQGSKPVWLQRWEAEGKSLDSVII